MAKYGKFLAWVGPAVLPLVVAGVRKLLKKKDLRDGPGEDDVAPQRNTLDKLVDLGHFGLTRGRGKGHG